MKDIKEIINKIKDNTLPDELYDEYSENLLKESDRGCVIISAEMLNNSLESLLRLSFREGKDQKNIDGLFSTYAPLSTFSARISVSYATKLITSNMYTSLNIIRKMRNRFAHDNQVIDFQDQSINDLLSNLISKKVSSIPSEKFYSNLPEPIKSRGMFSLCVIELLSKKGFISDAMKEGIYHMKIVESMELSGL